MARGDDTNIGAFLFECVFRAVIAAIFDPRLFIEYRERVEVFYRFDI